MDISMRGSILLIIASGLYGCGGGAPTDIIDPVPIDTSGLLKQVSTAGEFEASLKAGLTAIREIPPETLAAAAQASQDNFTTTYTLEQDVDEFDVVKYDGSHMFIAPQRRYYSCCFFLPLEAAPPAADVIALPPPEQRSIRIMETDPATGAATEIAAIALSENESVQGMYLDQDRLVTLTTESFWGRFGELWADIAVWADQATGLAIYDTSDATTPALLFKAQIEGGFIESRRVGSIVYLITRHTPTIAGLNYYVTTAGEQAANESILATVTLEEMLPQISINGEVSNLFDPTDCYVTNDDDGVGYPVITSITAVPIDNPEAHRTFCYDEEAFGVYVSENAVYLSQIRFVMDEGRTRLHKFAFAGNSLSYRGSAEVDGFLWSGGQSDFRISEHDGFIRLVTTEFTSDSSDFIDHHLFILEESTTSLALRQVARLPNADQPEEIGKPNEQLYGVRFFADRAYAVTFEQIDPLYVIDLSDPHQPRISGQLAVTGFSDFLHPVSADLLFGLGRSASGGIKLELFDVSDITNPLSLGSDSLGGNGSYSEARFDRHAFTYQADVNGIDRFIIPADLYATDGSYQFQESGLYFYEIRDKATPNLASLNRAGSLIVPDDGSGLSLFAGSRNRSILHNDTVFYVRDEDVWSTFWTSPGVVNGPF